MPAITAHTRCACLWRPLAPWLIALGSLLLGCSDDAHDARVSTGGTSARRDAGDDPDGGSANPARGEQPLWPNADGELELPYRKGSASYDLALDADLSQLDLHINVDTTASIGAEIDALQRELRTSVIDALSSRVPDVSFGVSRFADFPRTPFGRGDATSGDRAFVLLTPITRDRTRVTSAVSRLDNPLDDGGDDDEAGAEALYQIATGAGYESGGFTFIAPWAGLAAVGGGTLGGVGFRPFAMKVVLHVTDAGSHTPAEYALGELPGTHGMEQAATVLSALGARVIGIMSTSCESDDCRRQARYTRLRSELSRIAWQTQAFIADDDGRCPTGIEGAVLPTYEGGCPLVFDVRANGSGIAGTLTGAVIGLLDGLVFGEVHGEVSGDPLGFVTGIEALVATQPDDAPSPARADHLPVDDPDGVDDTYLAVGKRARLAFRVHLRNDRLAATDREQRFRIVVHVLGDGAVLAERTLRIVVPARAPTTNTVDASQTPVSEGGPGSHRDAATSDDAGL